MSYIDDLNALRTYISTGPALDTQADAVIILYRILKGLENSNINVETSNIYTLLSQIDTSVRELSNTPTTEDLREAFETAIKGLVPTTTVYVSPNGDDSNTGYKLAPVKTIAVAIQKAVELSPNINKPITIKLAAGIYEIVAPLILPRDISLISDTPNTVIIKPTLDTETNNLLLVDSNSTIKNINFSGHQAGAFAIALNDQVNNSVFVPGGLGAYITRPVFITDCVAMTASVSDGLIIEGIQVNEATGGAVEIDGAKCAPNSPTKSIIIHNFNAMCYNGSGFLVKNSAQGHFHKCVSSYCQYHLKTESGGTAFVHSNINNYGLLGLVATGYNPTPEGEGVVDGLITQRTVTISNLSTGAKVYKGSLLNVGGNVYKITNLETTAGGYQATLDRELVNTLAFSQGTLHRVSKIVANNHFFNHLGSGVDYRALAENNTVDVPDNKAIQEDEGIVIYTSMDNVGNINLGNSITIDGSTGITSINNSYELLNLDNLEANFKLDDKTNEVIQNITNTPDGVVPKPFSFNPYNFTSEQIQLLSNRINGGSTYQIYVDIDNPNASDSKDNRGNTSLRPFRTLERALVETARRSFAKGTNNDVYNRVSIYVAPGIYRLNNGRGGVVESEFFNRYQDAANLILKNLNDIAEDAYSLLLFVSDDTEELRTALRSIVFSSINYLADDLSSLGNKQIVSFARTMAQPTSPSPGEPGFTTAAFLNPFYYNLSLDNNGSQRNNSLLSGLVNALYRVRDNAIAAMRNLGVEKDDSITVDPANPTCENVASSISTLIDILVNTLLSINNPFDTQINVGSMLREFPLEGEPSDAILQSFNDPVNSGIILPRGVSIIGADLRKVIFKPKYVPKPTNALEGRASIFRMTGGNFFQGFTILDQDPQDRNYAPATSHHKLTAFSFCTLNDLELYYNTVTVAFSDRSIYNKAQDAANLLEANYDWLIEKLPFPIEPLPKLKRYKEIFIAQLPYFIQALILDLQQLGKTNTQNYANKFLNLHIKTLESELKSEAVEFYNQQIEHTFNYLVQAINNLANESEGGKRDLRVTFDVSPEGQCTDVVTAIRNYLEIMKAIISETLEPDLVNDRFTQSDSEVMDKETSIVIPSTASLSNPKLADTVQGASPYIFSASVRSEYGMCGIDGDGALVSGLKSYLAAQFTIISLQKDEAAFTPKGGENEVNRVRYQGSKLTDFSDETLSDWRHFGYRVINGAYSQLVSCFCICPAVHYWAGSGGEFSITNSTSNFGDISLYAEGYNQKPFEQDKGVDLIGIVKPLDLPDIRTLNAEKADIFPLGVIESLEDLGGNIRRITLSGLAKYLDRYTIDNNLRPDGEPDRISYIYVSSVSNIDRKGAVISTELDGTGTKTIITVDITNGGFWTTDRLDRTESTVIGKQVFIKRFVDTRKPIEREYQLILKRNLPLIGKRRPVIHFVIQQSVATNTPQPFSLNYTDTRSVFYVLNIDNTDTLEQSSEVCYIMRLATLNATNIGELETEVDLETNTVLDLDYDPSDPSLANVLNKDTYSRQNISIFLSKIGLSAIVNQLDITANNILNLRSQNIKLDFLKPSIIRCGSQTWEYMGYYNYSSGLPALQFRKLGEDFTSEALVKLFRISKTQTSILGGRIYATGMDEEGNSYVGNTIIDLKTGKQEEIVRGSSQEVLLAFDTPDIEFPQSYDNLIITNLTVDNINSNVTIEGNLTVNGSINTEALPIADDKTLGIVRLGTDDEVIDESSDEVAITPAKLKKWRIANKIISGATTNSRVYVSNRRDVNGNYLGHSAAEPYKAQYGSEHGAAITANEYTANINNPNNDGNFIQLSNPAAINFRCLRDMLEVSAFGNANLTNNDRLTLHIDPGKYRADYTYNFGIFINGANNKGAAGWGNPDGSDIAEDGSAGGVILYVTTAVGLGQSTSTLTWGQRTIRIDSTSHTNIQFVHIWSWITAVKDLDTEWDIKAKGENTLDQCLTRANNVAYSSHPTYLRSEYNACWDGFNRMKAVIQFFGTGRKSLYWCTFSGLGVSVSSAARTGSYAGAYINTYTDCRLDLGCITLRGNEEIRFSDKHGRLIKTPENSTPVLVPNNIYKDQPSNWTYEPIYNSDGTINSGSFYGGYHTSGFFHDPFNEEWVCIGFCEDFLNITRDTSLSFSFYGRGSNTSHFGDTTLSPYGTRDNRLVHLTTHNNDLHCIRLEKNTGKLYGLEDKRIVNDSTSIIEVDLIAKISYRGTDNLGYKAKDLYPPTIWSGSQFINQTQWETWVADFTNQGPIIENFINNNSFKLIGPFGLWGANSHKGIYTPGLLGQFGYKPRISGNKQLLPIETNKLLDYSVYARSVSLSNGQGAKLELSYHDGSNLLNPAWKGFNDTYYYAVLVNTPNFSTVVEEAKNNDFSSAISVILNDGHNLDGSNVGARFVLVGSNSNEHWSIIYLGYYFEDGIKKYYFANFGASISNANRIVDNYLQVKNNHDPANGQPRIFNTFNELLSANLTVVTETIGGTLTVATTILVYVKECNLFFERVIRNSTDHGSNKSYSWRFRDDLVIDDFSVAQAWRNLNLATNNIQAGYYLEKSGFEANNATNYSNLSSIPSLPILIAGWNANTIYLGLDVSTTFNI